MEADIIEGQIEELIKYSSNTKIQSVVALPITASNRKYFRVFLDNEDTAIVVYNEDVRENEAFFSFAKSLKISFGRVPQILSISDDRKWYLQDDLGKKTLYDILVLGLDNEKRKTIYQSVIKDLIHLQIDSSRDLDFTKAYPRPAFDKQSISWDLNYFKYYFLKFSGINFDEQRLEDDYNSLIEMLLKVPSNYFMYRDFQSRNIMVDNDEFYYIDFQGGRKGPLQYDLASLIFDAKAHLPNEFKLEMLAYYYNAFPDEIRNEQPDFTKDFWLFALVRVLQAMGAYGFRGLFEKKQHFIKSIPLALSNLEFILQQLETNNISYLTALLKQLKSSAFLQKYIPVPEPHKLKVKIGSFSYKKGLPKDDSEHGGGFVFDCRAIHNPGRYEDYKHLTGKDDAVKAFFQATPSMGAFLSEVYELVDASVRKYIERDFDSLSVYFGCTGGQHRSVYSAESLKTHLQEKFNISIELYHREIG